MKNLVVVDRQLNTLYTASSNVLEQYLNINYSCTTVRPCIAMTKMQFALACVVKYIAFITIEHQKALLASRILHRLVHQNLQFTCFPNTCPLPPQIARGRLTPCNQDQINSDFEVH